MKRGALRSHPRYLAHRCSVPTLIPPAQIIQKMRHKSKTYSLEAKFPLLAIEQGCLISKDADITVAFRVERTRALHRDLGGV